MSKRIYAVVYKNGQVDAWSTNQGPPSMPYVHEWEVQSEIDSLQVEIERLNEEIKQLKESASAPKKAAEQLSPTEEFIAQLAAYRIKTEVQGEDRNKTPIIWGRILGCCLNHAVDQTGRDR